ncbi:MAG: asparaginase [Solirubrobacterales bacterium]
MTQSASPLLIEVTRGDTVESRHLGAAVVADADGRVVSAWGECGRATFPRSALKPIQALPLAESGAVEAFGLGTEHLALAAASHSGEAAHVERVEAWLSRIGLDVTALECGAHAPSNPEAAARLIKTDGSPCPLHNNCSGKHTGFLTVARQLGLPHRGYIGHDHPVQQLVSAAISDMTGVATAQAAWGTDGCGIPTYALPLSAIATAMARMADPARLPPGRAKAARAIVAAMLEHPHLVAGSGRLCTRFMQAVPRIAVKGGAEGCYTAIIPEKGWGVALKIDDGAGRAAEVAILAVLTKLGMLTAEESRDLADRIAVPLPNVAGKIVGEVRAGF